MSASLRETGSCPSGHAASGVDDGSRFDPARKWTPGPWAIEDPFDFELSIVANGDKAPGDWAFVAGCKLPDEDDHDITGREAYANARLIAAAPELYEAAMTALGLIEPLTAQGEDAIWRPANKAWETLVAATRKARGEA